MGYACYLPNMSAWMTPSYRSTASRLLALLLLEACSCIINNCNICVRVLALDCTSDRIWNPIVCSNDYAWVIHYSLYLSMFDSRNLSSFTVKALQQVPGEHHIKCFGSPVPEKGGEKGMIDDQDNFFQLIGTADWYRLIKINMHYWDTFWTEESEMIFLSILDPSSIKGASLRYLSHFQTHPVIGQKFFLGNGFAWSKSSILHLLPSKSGRWKKAESPFRFPSDSAHNFFLPQRLKDSFGIAFLPLPA